MKFEPGACVLHPIDRANAILKVPHRRTIRDIRRYRQTAKPLKAQPVQKLKLDLLARHIVQSFKHQNPNSGLSRKGRATAFGGNHSWGDAINLARQGRKVHHITALDQRITKELSILGALDSGANRSLLIAPRGFIARPLINITMPIFYENITQSEVFRGALTNHRRTSS